MNKITKEGHASVYMVIFANDTAVINRLQKEIGDKNIRYIKAGSLSANVGEQKIIKECVLLASDKTDIILLDGQHRIRGQYSSANLGDVDRLILESKIILKQY